MKIEVPSIEDYEKINALAALLHDLHVSFRPDIFIHTDEIFTKDELKEMIENKSIFVAKINEQVVGYVLIGGVKEGVKPGYHYRKELPIDALVVDSNYRQRGIGTKLFEYVVSYAKDMGCTGVHLTVSKENTEAIKLYEKMGMKVKNIAYTMHL